MKRERAFIVGLVLIFLLCGLLLSLIGPRDELPLDSRSNAPDGLRALYLTLEELGFSVRRKTGPIEKIGNGVILEFGSEYLTAEDRAIREWRENGGFYYQAEQPWSLVNENITAGDVYQLLLILWPYHDQTLWFNEYGRRLSAPSVDEAVLTPVNILPQWIFLPLLQLGLLLLLALLLWGGRLGPPLRAERGRRRDDREDAQALAVLMERSGLLPDALRLCYRRLCESARESYPRLEAACDVPPTQPDRALALAEEMDELIRNSEFGIRN